MDMSYLSEQQLDRISDIVREVEKLSDVEKFLLYLQLPGSRSESTEGKCRQNGNNKHGADIFSKKPDQEATQTYTWILSHLEEDQNVSLPKQEVYDEYRAYCQANRFEPLCVADFGKAMKHALPCIKPRRLGQRGNSRYCYSGLRKKYRIEPPTLPDMAELGSDSCNQSSPQAHCQDNIQRMPTNCSNYEQLRPAPTTLATSTASSISSCSSSSSSSSSSSTSSSVSSTSSRNSNSHRDQTPAQKTNNNNNNNNNAIKIKQEANRTLADCATANINNEPTAACCQPASLASINEQSGACGPIQATTSGQLMGMNTNLATNTNLQNTQGAHLQQRRLIRHNPQAGMISSGLNQLAHNQYNQPHQHQDQRLSQPIGTHQQLSTIPRFDHHHHLQSASSSYHDYQLRTGTPDDDDYRHNYHDLNRPMLGPAIIPFSQSLTAQLAQQPASHESFLSYNTSAPYAPTGGVHIVDNAYQQQQQQTTQLLHQPIHSPTKLLVPLGEEPQRISQRRHILEPASPGCCAALETPLNKQIKSIESGCDLTQIRQPFEQIGSNEDNINNPHDGQPQEIDDQCQAEARQQFEQTLSESKYTTLAHLNLNLNETMTGTDIDFASPFQSPASTPYPVIASASYLSPETQDCCSGECGIQYSTDH